MLDNTFEELIAVVKYDKNTPIYTIFKHQKAENKSVVSILVIYNNNIYINNIDSEWKQKPPIFSKPAHLTNNPQSHPTQQTRPYPATTPFSSADAYNIVTATIKHAVNSIKEKSIYGLNKPHSPQASPATLVGGGDRR